LFFFDVFDLEGKYIARVPVPANLNRNSVWKRHKLYTIDEDNDGFPVVKRPAACQSGRTISSGH